MNRLAGIALLCLPDEVDAFWALVTITEHLLPGYYGDTMRELLIDQRVLAELVAEKLPRLAVHLKAQYIDINLFSFNWFLVIFVDSTLPYVFMPLWDAFMLEGKKVLFRYALAMLKYWERDLLALDSCSALNNFLRSMGERVNTPAAAARLRRIAFGEMNPLAGRMIERKRRAHRTAVEIELASIQRARSEIRNASAAAAAVEVGTETLNLLNVQRVEREQQQSRNTTTEDDDFAEPSRLLTTDLDSVNSLYFAADAVNKSDDDDDNDSWHSVQSSYNYDNFDDSAGSPYCRRGRGNESDSQVGIRVESTSVAEDYAGDRFCESAPDLSSPVEVSGEQKDAKDSTLRRSASYHNMDGGALEKFMPAPNERPKSAEPNFDISQTDASAVFDSVQHTAQSSEREYFSTRCPSQISASRSDSTATGPTPIPPPRKIRQRQLSAGSPTRFTRLLSRATAIRSSFGGTAATKKAMLNRAISNAASRHGEFLKRKMGPKQPILTQATADNSLTNSDEVLHMEKKCEHYNKPMLLSHDVKEPGLSTFYYKMLRKCHCAMDLDTERQNKNSVNAGEIMSTSNEAEANSVFFHSGFKNYAVDNNGNDDIDNVLHALPGTDEIIAADATPTRRRSSFAITLRSAVTQRLGQLIPAANNGPPYVISEPQQDDFGNWRGKIIGESNAGTAAYRTTPETTGALVAVQEFTEVSISTTKQSCTSSQVGKNWADRNAQKVGDSSRFILKLPQHEPFTYGEILPSMKPINF